MQGMKKMSLLYKFSPYLLLTGVGGVVYRVYERCPTTGSIAELVFTNHAAASLNDKAWATCLYGVAYAREEQ